MGVGLGMAAGCLLLAAFHVADRHLPLCTLRSLTGVPCPLCGGTTAAAALGHLDLRGALAANPVAVVGGILLAAAPLGVARRWWLLPYRARSLVLGAALIGSELWQLHRVGLIG
ncbi:MAG: hypothetical protein QOK42_1944 [Frankiaceae bacterium]|jgi:hypothetical protein|nr:hypothetical protein [Frankiaceae bacterium]MDX6224649.1 hypothetical protein [Frankiales bacterium]MDX6273713.1 hypothetical protein [Frankiales bacterium]